MSTSIHAGGTIELLSNGEPMTIAEALKAVSPGGMVHLRPGNYGDGDVEICDGVTLEGVGAKDKVILKYARFGKGGGRLLSLTVVDSVICRLWGGEIVVLDNLIVNDRVSIEHAKVDILRCKIGGKVWVGGVGPEAQNHPHTFVEVSASELGSTDANECIEAHNSTIKIIESSITGETGITIKENCNIRVDRCQFEKFRDGIWVWPQCHGRLVVCDSNLSHGRRGVNLSGNYKTQLQNCVISHNTGCGVTVGGGTAVIEHCKIESNGDYGISFHDGTHGAIRHCKFRGNRRGPHDVNWEHPLMRFKVSLKGNITE